MASVTSRDLCMFVAYAKDIVAASVSSGHIRLTGQDTMEEKHEVDSEGHRTITRTIDRGGPDVRQVLALHEELTRGLLNIYIKLQREAEAKERPAAPKGAPHG